MHRYPISLLVFAMVAALCGSAIPARSQSHAKRASISFLISNNRGQVASLTTGLHENATKGLDPSVGEQELPPAPPQEIFDARLVAPASGIILGEGSSIDYRPWPASGQTVTENYRVRYQAGRTWPSVSLRLPATFSENIRSVRIDNKAVKAGDSVVSLLASGDMNIAVEYLLDPVTFTVAPQAVVFPLGNRDTTLPAMKTVRVTPSTATASWSVSASDSWIDIDRTSGTGPQDLRIGINHLAFEEGRTSGAVIIRQSIGTAPVSIPVHVDMVTALDATPEPVGFTVGEAYPNPITISSGFAGVTLGYTLDAPAPVTVSVHDALGRKVRTVDAAAMRGAGRHTAVWDLRGDGGSRLSAGVYRMRVEVGGASRVRSIIVR
ncbi:MAG: hypothetical protein IPP94_11335 [Ignavibacteria bacterium]|nr:hypothetical protein [Ignavibacteria bacterium]